MNNKNKNKEQLWAIIHYDDLWVGCTGCPEDVIEEDSNVKFIKITADEWEEWENDKLHFKDIKDRPRYYAEIQTKIKMVKL